MLNIGFSGISGMPGPTDQVRGLKAHDAAIVQHHDLDREVVAMSVSISMPEKPIAESPKKWMTGRSGCATQAAIAWPRPTPSCRRCRR